MTPRDASPARGALSTGLANRRAVVRLVADLAGRAAPRAHGRKRARRHVAISAVGRTDILLLAPRATALAALPGRRRSPAAAQPTAGMQP